MLTTPTYFNRSMRILLTILFAAELIAGIYTMINLNKHYNGVMDVGFLVTLPLLGIVTCLTFRRATPIRVKLFYVYQLLVFLLVPLMAWGFYPKYSYEEARSAVMAQLNDSTSYEWDTTRSGILLEDSGNWLINKAYLFRLVENGETIEYVVSPVSGRAIKLEP